jgi:hypothetical protein
MTQAYNLSQLANNLDTNGRLDATDGLVNAVPATNGGTGQAGYAVGDLLYASTTTALSKLADVATGSALLSGGVNLAPAYGKVGLTTHVTGTLPVANGGTGATTLTSNNVLLGNGTSAPQTVAPGASGNVLTSNGTTWASVAPSSGGGGVTSAVAGNGVAVSAATGAVTFSAAAPGYNTVGSYAMGNPAVVVVEGTTYSAANAGIVGGTGTWRCMGQFKSVVSGEFVTYITTALFVKTA